MSSLSDIEHLKRKDQVRRHPNDWACKRCFGYYRKLHSAVCLRKLYRYRAWTLGKQPYCVIGDRIVRIYSGRSLLCGQHKMSLVSGNEPHKRRISN